MFEEEEAEKLHLMEEQGQECIHCKRVLELDMVEEYVLENGEVVHSECTDEERYLRKIAPKGQNR